MKREELRRQAVHCAVGVLVSLFALYAFSDGRELVLFGDFAITPLSAVFLSGSLLSLSISALSKFRNISFIEFLLDHMENRPSRSYFPGKGVFFFLFGAFVVSIFFGREAVFASIFVVSVGDSVSHVVGKEFGRIPHPLSRDKYLEGHVVGAVLAALGASFIGNMNLTTIIVAALIAMYVEGIYFGEKLEVLMDDNLVVQVVFAVSLYLIA